MIRVAVDAMGGDNAPEQIVFGAIDALLDRKDLEIQLVGKENEIRKVLGAVKADPNRKDFDESRVKVIPASEIIETGEPPVEAIRSKKDSSIVVALRQVREKQADAFVSSGSTGAVLVGGQVMVGKAKGVLRTPLAPLIPTLKGVSLLVDCGANVDARPPQLVQFARMGSVYMKEIMNIEKPKVGILNIGAEEDKGNALVKETYPLLKECKDINFIGNVEARDLVNGEADVVVCDAFAGNIALKMYEGVGKALIGEIKNAMLSNTKGKLGALLVKNNLKSVVKKFDASEYGGAPMLGLKGLVVKSHGNAKAKEIHNAILQCCDFVKQGVTEKMETSLLDASKKETSDQ